MTWPGQKGIGLAPKQSQQLCATQEFAKKIALRRSKWKNKNQKQEKNRIELYKGHRGPKRTTTWLAGQTKPVEEMLLTPKTKLQEDADDEDEPGNEAKPEDAESILGPEMWSRGGKDNNEIS